MYKPVKIGNNCFEVNMKAKWKDEEIVKLFSLIEENNKKNLSTMHSFKQYAKQSGKNPLTIRNFYYSHLKVLKNNTLLCQKLGIDVSKHKIQIFEHFDKIQESELLKKIAEYKENGFSTRNACMKLSDGNAKQMLRIQNKLRNITRKTKQSTTNSLDNLKTNKQTPKMEDTKVIQFPTNGFNKKSRLTDDEIKSLFMGLVKLVKENADADKKEKAEKFLEQTEEEKRKRIVELEQKQTEIDVLKQQLNELKIKNSSLNKQLEFYRIEYVQKLDLAPNL